MAERRNRWRVALLANEDFAAILRHTIRTWGFAQGDSYLALLADGRNRIIANPNLRGSKTREDLAEGCRSYKVAKHIIFYRVSGDEVQIGRILHDSMDFIRHNRGDSFE